MELQQHKRSTRAILKDAARPWVGNNSFIEGLVYGRIDSASEGEIERARLAVIKCAKELES